MGPLVLVFTSVNPKRRNVLGVSKGDDPVGFFGPEAIGRLLKLCTPGRREFRGKRVMAANDPRARSVQRILLAEDDEDMRRFLVKALEKAGYDVVSFSNGLEA